jgi:hypothetical protein
MNAFDALTLAHGRPGAAPPAPGYPLQPTDKTLEQSGIDGRNNKPLGSRLHSFEGDGDRGNQKDRPYQDAEAASDEGVGILHRKETAGRACRLAQEGDQTERRKSERQDDQTQADRECL